MTSSIPSTPRAKNCTSKTPSRTPRRLCRRALAPPETPDFLNNTGATPISLRRCVSKDKSTEISNGLTVAVRVRPMNNRELSCSTVYDTVTVKGNELTVKAVSPGSVGVGITHMFQYDHVFWSSEPGRKGHASQKDVFEAMGTPLLDSAFKGYNACLFAYGQTGSGKSYSMMGEHSDLDIEQNENAGIIPRFSYELFSRISQLPTKSSATVEVSYFEIYNERIYDLLAVPTSMTGLDRRTPLKVREHPVWGPYVVNLSPHVVKSFTEFKNMLLVGNKYRATAATFINEKSSRSHSIVSIELSLNEIDNEGTDSGRRSKISLVDLAGSERVGNNSSNDDRHREGVSINQSLLTLGKVISALADPRRTTSFIPYRDSTLTWLLRESLGGNSLTSMLATITPASSYVDETLATLRYACQARSIVNRAYVNENPHDRLIRELRAEVDRLRALRQDYERTSCTPAPIQANDASIQELADLRQRLSTTERNLEEAQKLWEKKFVETRQRQMKELAEAERRKMELESHVRVMSNVDLNKQISPYKSNFLQELEELIGAKREETSDIHALIEDTNEWCTNHNLHVTVAYDKNSGMINVKDVFGDMNALCSTAHLENRLHYNHYPEDFLNCLEWKMGEKGNLSARCSVYKYMQHIRNAMTAMKPVVTDEDENLRVAYTQLNTAIRNFEKVYNSSKALSKQNKSVKFEL
ncbi:nebbish [Carabus blaptoides fortunei]